MRLGGPIFTEYNSPDEWVAAVKALGYGAAYCPVGLDAGEAEIQAYADAAATNDIVISEVGAWSNPISPDPEARREAIAKNIRALALADKIGARCCVNIAGSRGEDWDGPHPDNFAEPTFALIVETTREIIDAVQPERTFYTLETMPWIFPDSPDSYQRIIEAVDRPQLAVHLDPVNMISSPRRYYNNGAFLRECFEKLGPYIQNCHGKDIRLEGELTVHLNEVRPGLGELDYRVFLTELDKLDPDVALMLEHLKMPEEYNQAAVYVRSVAAELGLAFKS